MLAGIVTYKLLQGKEKTKQNIAKQKKRRGERWVKKTVKMRTVQKMNKSLKCLRSFSGCGAHETPAWRVQVSISGSAILEMKLKRRKERKGLKLGYRGIGSAS